MHTNIKAAIFLLALRTYANACPQDKMMRGTVIVTGLSQAKIVVAADSRRVPPFGPPDDNVCKILALDDKSVFMAAGTTSAGSGNTTYWDAYDRTGKIFRTV